MIVCRLCLGKESAQYYNINYGVPSIKQKLRLCQPELDDNFLEDAVICEHCLANIYMSFDFKKKCLSTMETVKEMSNNYTSQTKFNSIMTPSTNSKNEVAMIPLQDQARLQGLKKLKIINLDNDEDRKQLLAAVQSDGKSKAPKSKVKLNRKRLQIVCKICHRQYLTLSQLRKHMLIHNTNNLQKRLPTIISTLPTEVLRSINKELKDNCVAVSCSSCKIRLKCNHELKYHRATYHNGIKVNPIHFKVTCEVCKMTFSHVYLTYHMKSHLYKVHLEDIFGGGNTVSEGSFFIVKFWKCDICDLFFNNSEDSVMHHLKTHKID